MSFEAQTDNNGEIVQQIETQMEKCPNCGANLVFEPNSQTLYCEHCGTSQSLPEMLTVLEQNVLDGFDQVKSQWSGDETVVFSCDNCGAKVVLQKDETASSCPFCGTSHVVKTDELAGIKPHGLIPFSFGLKEGVDYAKKWAKSRLYAPRKFKKTLSAENVKGVYAPCFTFDSNTFSTYYGRIGKRYTRVVGSGKNRRTETYIVGRNVSGTFGYSFDDLLITAGSKFDQKKMDKVSPFDTNNGKSYDESYLLGFMAYHYDTELKDCWQQAKNRMDATIRSRILAQYSYDVVSFLNVSTTHGNVTYKYVMLPVYIGNYKYGKKLYNFFVNGSTGKTTGKTPVSALKVALTVLAGLCVIAGIVALTLL